MSSKKNCTGNATVKKQKIEEQKTAVLEATLENMAQGITMVDTDLNAVAYNHKFFELLMLPPERFGERFNLIDVFRFLAQRGDFGRGDIEQLVAERAGIARRREPMLFEHHCPNGRVIEIRANPVSGGLRVATYTDVSDTRRVQQALRESEERYALAVEAVNEAIYDWDAIRNDMYVSPRLQSLLQLRTKVSSMTPARWRARIHPDDLEHYLHHLRAHLRGETPYFDCEFRILRGDGEYIWVQQRGLGLRDQNGRVYRWAGSVGDISARKRSEIELHRAKDAALAASQAKSSFLANMSHELRTPLNAIIGFTRLVMRRSRNDLPAQQYENLEKILASSQQLLALINDILDLSRIEAGRMDFHTDDIDAAALIDECLRLVEPMRQNARVVLKKTVDPGLPLIHTDRDKLRQILLNLLSNAVKFTEQGEVRVEAARAAGAQGGETVRFRIIDTGIGIPQASLDRIFDEFQQVDDSTTRRHGGTGLGLSITRRLTRLIGGEITVSSILHQGSVFTVSLPLRFYGLSSSQSST